eukprot:760781-Hanusia_phi.AAC.5
MDVQREYKEQQVQNKPLYSSDRGVYQEQVVHEEKQKVLRNSFSAFPNPPASHAEPAQICGVGILFAEVVDMYSHTKVVVQEVYANGPASHSGRIQSGDFLQAVNDINVSGMLLHHLRQYIPGPRGSKVKLTFMTERTREVYNVVLERGPVNSQNRPEVQSRSAGASNETSGQLDSYKASHSALTSAVVNRLQDILAMVGFSVQRSATGEIIVANVTQDSSAEENMMEVMIRTRVFLFSFITHAPQFGEVLLEIDDQPIPEQLSENAVRRMLSGRTGSMVKVRTDRRVAIVQRDCAAEFDEEDRSMEYPRPYEMPQHPQQPQTPRSWVSANDMELQMRPANVSHLPPPRQAQYITTKPSQREFLQLRPVLMDNQAARSKQMNFIHSSKMPVLSARHQLQPMVYANAQQGVAAGFANQGAMLPPRSVAGYAVNRSNVGMTMGMPLVHNAVYPQFQQQHMAFRNF